MRDPNRIPIFCYKLAKIWENFPDWRFGQLISNLTSRKDIFYIEDDDFLKQLEDIVLVFPETSLDKKITNQIESEQISLFDKAYIYSGKSPEIYLKENENE